MKWEASTWNINSYTTDKMLCEIYFIGGDLYLKLDVLMNVSSVQLTTETKSVEMYTESPVLLNISVNLETKS